MKGAILFSLLAVFLIITSFHPKKQNTSKQQEIKSILCKAIQQKKLVKFFYDDKYSDISDWRVVEPHLVGDHKSTGNTTLVAWFLPTTSQSASGHSEEWGNYLIDRIRNLEIFDKTFQKTRPLYNPNDKRMKTIYCNVPIAKVRVSRTIHSLK